MRRRYRRREFVFASAWFRGEATVQRDAGDGQSVGHRPIEVDVSSLAQLAKTLRDEVELNYHPQAQRVIDTIDPGNDALPPKPIEEWEAARNQYKAGRNRAIDLLSGYESATLQIADAADFIAQRYREMCQANSPGSPLGSARSRPRSSVTSPAVTARARASWSLRWP